MSAQDDFFDDDGNVKPPDEMKSTDPQNLTEEQQALLNRVNREVKGWRPAPGDVVLGVLVEISEAESEFGIYPLLTIEEPDGNLVNVHAFHAVLKNNLQRKLDHGTLTEGDDIAISYRGQGPATAGRNGPYLYNVQVVHRP